MLKEVKDLGYTDCRVIITNVANDMKISVGTVQSNMNEDWNINKDSLCCIPCQLKDQIKIILLINSYSFPEIACSEGCPAPTIVFLPY